MLCGLRETSFTLLPPGTAVLVCVHSIQDRLTECGQLFEELRGLARFRGLLDLTRQFKGSFRVGNGVVGSRRYMRRMRLHTVRCTLGTRC